MSDEQMIKETFFVSHGMPRLMIGRQLLAGWRENVYSKRPKSILVISAHWETDQSTVNAVDLCDTIYDFDSFPAYMYQFKYPAPGAPDLAKRVQELLMASGLKCVHMDKKRGLDHGAWVPLLLMYPEADIPVCQLSILPHLDGTYHFNLGRALAPLKEEGVLIIGSGNATHPASDTPRCSDGVAPWAAQFDDWLKEALTTGRYEVVNNCETKAPHWKKAHPLPEHFYPLHVAMGAAGESFRAEQIHISWDQGIMSNASYKFTSS
uniref:stizolobate synthase n=1 Tax=Telephium imperati TaxID=645216 RepID=A0A5B8XED8_9CARY|nr:DODA [Telephium imperati]QED21498.1 DODA [Telephium imperati]